MSENRTRADQDMVTQSLIRHERMIKAYVFSSLENWSWTDDVFQEVAVYVLNHWQDFEPGTNFGAWIRAIARNRCHEFLRARRTGEEIPMDRTAVESLAPGNALDDAAWDDEGPFTSDQKQALSECVKALPEKSRAMVRLRYEENKSCPAVATALKASVSAVYMTLCRLRIRLQECVEKRLLERAT